MRDLGALPGVGRLITPLGSISTGPGSDSGTGGVVVLTPTTIPTELPTDAPVTSTASPATPPTPVSKEIPFVAPEPADCSAPPGGQIVPGTPVQPSGPTLPPAGEAPADAQSAEAAVHEMWTLAFSATTPDAERYALHEVYGDHPDVFDGGLPQNQQYRDNLSVKVLGIVFESPTRAAVRYQFEFPALHSMQSPDIGYAVLTADGWKVARETTCALVAKGGRQCPTP